MPAHGNFDDVIRQTMKGTMEENLKLWEKDMEPPPKHRPKVEMEKGKHETDYPPTRKYDYVPYGRKLNQRGMAQEYLDELLRDSDPQQRRMPLSEQDPLFEPYPYAQDA